MQTPVVTIPTSKGQVLLFHFTKISNLPSIVAHGALHSPNHMPALANPVQVGNPQITADRGSKYIVCNRTQKALGTLHNYVPFYFTPLSQMLFQVITGNGPVIMTPKTELVMIICDLKNLLSTQYRVVVANGHAFNKLTEFESAPVDLPSFIDIPTITSGDFKRRDDDFDRTRRYQAEALVYQQIRIVDLLGLAVCSAAVKARVEEICVDSPLSSRIGIRPNYFFP